MESKNQITEDNEYLTSKEAAKFLRIKVKYLYQLTYTKKLPFYRPFGRKILFRKSELERHIASKKVN